MKSIHTDVREVLARHLDVPASSILHRQSLDDLDLGPLELVLLTREIEELEEVEPISTFGLENLQTVGEYLVFMTDAVTRRRKAKPWPHVA
jgi:hypothetical protein